MEKIYHLFRDSNTRYIFKVSQIEKQILSRQGDQHLLLLHLTSILGNIMETECNSHGLYRQLTHPKIMTFGQDPSLSQCLGCEMIQRPDSLCKLFIVF